MMYGVAGPDLAGAGQQPTSLHYWPAGLQAASPLYNWLPCIIFVYNVTSRYYCVLTRSYLKDLPKQLLGAIQASLSVWGISDIFGEQNEELRDHTYMIIPSRRSFWSNMLQISKPLKGRTQDQVPNCCAAQNET